MELNKQALKFMNRKSVKEKLKNKHLTDLHFFRLNRLFKLYSCKELENMHGTIANFVLYDLNNFEGRLRRLRGIPGTNKYTQLLRYGKKHYLDVMSEQTSRKTNHFKNKMSTWISMGYCKTEAAEKVSEVQKSRSILSPATQKGVTEFSVRCIAYWIKKGLTEQQAKLAVATVQCRKHTAERNNKWQHTLSLKTDEEKALINFKKGHSVESFQARGMNYEDALLASIEYYKKRKNYSSSSQVFFCLLDTLLKSSAVYYKVKNYEKQFNGKCVDFYDANSKIVVEYYGDFWHRNPQRYDPDFVSYGKSSAEIWKSDQHRIQIIAEHKDVKKVLVIWESEAMTNPHRVATHIIKEMQNVI